MRENTSRAAGSGFRQGWGGRGRTETVANLTCFLTLVGARGRGNVGAGAAGADARGAFPQRDRRKWLGQLQRSHGWWEGPIERARDAPAAPTAQSWWATRGRQEQGWGWEGAQPFCCRMLPPPLPRHVPRALLKLPGTGVKTDGFSMFKLPVYGMTQRNTEPNRLPCGKTQIYHFYFILWQLFPDTLTRVTAKCQLGCCWRRACCLPSKPEMSLAAAAVCGAGERWLGTYLPRGKAAAGFRRGETALLESLPSLISAKILEAHVGGD